MVCYVMLLVNNTRTNLHPISHRFPVIAQYWSNYRTGVPLFSAFVLGNFYEYRHNHKLPETRISWLQFYLASTNLAWLALKYNAFSVIAQNNGHFAVQGHSKLSILVPIESSYATSY